MAKSTKPAGTSPTKRVPPAPAQPVVSEEANAPVVETMEEITAAEDAEVVEEVVVEENTISSASAPEAEAPVVATSVESMEKEVDVLFLVGGEARIFGKLYRYTKDERKKLPADVAGILSNSGKLTVL